MAYCFNIDADNTLRSSSMEELKRLVFERYKGKVSPQSLIYYNMGPTTQIENVIDYCINNPGHDANAEKVTETCRKMVERDRVDTSASYDPVTKRDNTERVILKDFRLELGIKFHACLEWELDHKRKDPVKRNKAIDELVDWCIEQAKTISIADLQKSLPNDLLGTIPRFLSSLLESPTRSEADIKQQLADRILQLVTSMNNHPFLAGKTVRCEIPISWKDGSANVTGRIDAIIYDQDGNVWLIDWKTQTSEHSSETSRQIYAAQLEMYKKMLEKNHISAKSIKFLNAKFLLTADSKGPIIGDVQFTNPYDDMSGSARGQVDLFIRRYFPLEGKGLSHAEAKPRHEKLNSASVDLCDTLLIQKEEEKAIAADLASKIKNGQEYYSEWKEEWVSKWEVSGDKITGKTKDGHTIYNGLTIEEISKQESKKQKENSVETLTGLTAILREKSPESRDRLLKFLSTKNLKKQYGMYHTMMKYLSPSWDYVCVPDLEKHNVITMYNSRSNYYEFIVVIPDSGQLDYSPNPKANILQNMMKDVEEIKNVKQFQELPHSSVRNMHRMRAMMAIAEFSDLLKQEGKETVISGIKTLSTISGQGDTGRGLQPFIGAFNLMAYEAGTHPSKINHAEYIKEVSDKFKNLIFLETTPERQLEYMVEQVKCAIEAVSMNHSEDGFLKPESITMKYDELSDVMMYIKENYRNEYNDPTTEMGLLYSEIANLALKIKNLSPEDLYTTAQRSMTFQESVLAGIDLLRFGDTERFTKMGIRLTGLAQGLETTVSYASPDQMVLQVNKLFNAFSGQLVAELIKEAEEVNEATKKFIDKCQKRFYRKITGNHDDLYRSLLEKNSSGEISQDMYFINPYNDSTLDDDQKEYLEVVLWSINRHRMERLNFSDDAKKLSYKELKKHPEFYKQYVSLVKANRELLQMPLKLRGGFVGAFDGLANVVTGKTSVKDWVSKNEQKLKSYIEPILMTEAQSKQVEENVKNLEYSNYYKDTAHRADTTSKHQFNEWECNMNKLALDYIAADLKEKYFTDLLSLVDKHIATIRLMEITTGRDLSNQVEAIMNRVRVSIFNKSLIDDEDADMIKTMGFIKSIGSFTKIALRPALFMKEMILGRIRNTAAVLTNQIVNENEITMSHLTQAAGIVFGGDLFAKDERSLRKMVGEKRFGDFSFVEQINTTYQVNDRDLNAIGETLAYDRKGAHNWGSRMLYLNTIAPDNLNRMVLFVAKMIADGTIDAHSINEDGQLTYDISKDERVSYFWKNRNRNLEKDPKWVEQRAIYLNRMAQFKAEGWKNPDGSELQTGPDQYDPFPRAYTAQENDSIKEQIGLQYAYYAHEERANVQKGWWWTMYTEFMTFLPAEIRKYFASGNVDSSIGKLTHQKDPISGKKLYWKEEPSGIKRKVVGGETKGVSENGIDSTGKALEPVLEYDRHPLEGLAVSTAKTISQIVRGDWTSLKNNKRQIHNTELFFFNLLFGVLVGLLLKALISSDDVKSSSFKLAALSPIQKAANELNFVESLYSSVDSFNVVGVNVMQDIFADAFKTAGSEDYSLFDFANSTFGLVKDLHINDIA